MQGFQSATLCPAPIVWPLQTETGYSWWNNLSAYDDALVKDIPVRTMSDIV